MRDVSTALIAWKLGLEGSIVVLPKHSWQQLLCVLSFLSPFLHLQFSHSISNFLRSEATL